MEERHLRIFLGLVSGLSIPVAGAGGYLPYETAVEDFNAGINFMSCKRALKIVLSVEICQPLQQIYL